MVQYVKVTFPSYRKVWIDGSPVGFTNDILEVEAGLRCISLGPNSKNYVPDRYQVNVNGTAESEPLVMIFCRL